MKHGAYFRIPEGPADAERLWQEGAPLQPADLPSWLNREEAARYRYLGSAAWRRRPPRGAAYWAELAELRAVGLIVEPDSGDPGTVHVYVKSPDDEPVWAIALYAGDSPLRLAPAPGARNPVMTREQVSDLPAAFVADPFLIRVDGVWHMFFEVMHWRTGIGAIGLASSRDGLAWDYQGIVLAEPFHLSYPCVFRWNDDYYMIPESYQAGGVRLYRASRFPREWSLAGILLTGPYLADPTVFRYGGRSWLYADTSAGMAHDTLRLFVADELTGPWREHPRSPIVAGDARAARPAGRVQVVNERPVRYAQSCVPHYGTAVRAFEITRLTPAEYAEREVEGSPILGPAGTGWNACGMHHVDAYPLDDGRWLACVDGWTCPAILRRPPPSGGAGEARL